MASQKYSHRWNGVVGLFCASIEQLRANDRNVPFLGFILGATFLDIRQRLSKPEFATLRHINRALEELF
jgi:hypothetical protein